jgi:signal transduction histidine kinase/ligand-binding sensor domain-containing protein
MFRSLYSYNIYANPEAFVRRVTLIAIFFLITLSFSTTAQKGLGLPMLRNFTPKEYQAQVRNWSMVQDKRGVMYFGNNGGVLKFDGNHWRLIPVNNTIVRSLAIDKNDRVYVGAQGEIGYLDVDKQGKLNYVSLLHLLDSADRNFTDVWTAHVNNDTVYFHTVFKIFRITGTTVKTWNTSYSYHRSFIVNNQLYLRQDSIGLTRLENEEFKKVRGGEFFTQEFVSTMLPLSTNKILVGSRTKGLYIFDPKTNNPSISFQPFSNEANEYLKTNSVYSGTQLQNGNYAIGTTTGGVVEINPAGKWVNTYDESAGLQSNTAFYSYSEKNQNLAILHNGITLIEINSPLSFWGKGKGLRGTVLSSLWHNGVLYAGTADGLFYLDSIAQRFQKIDGIGIQCWQLRSYTGNGESSVLVFSTNGLFEIKGTKAYLVDGERCYSAVNHPSKRGVVLVGQDGLLLSIQKVKGKWIKKNVVVKRDNLFWSIAFDNQSNLWLSTEIHGFIKIKADYFSGQNELSEEIDPGYLSMYDTAQGLPSNTKTYVFNIHGKICAATTTGVFAYDEKSNRFIREQEIFKSFGPDRRVYQLAQDKYGNVWAETSKGKCVLKKEGNSWRLEETALKRLPALPEYISSSSVIYPDDDGIVWFGTVEGLFRFNPTFPKKYNVPFSALIRTVSINDSIRFWGNGDHAKLSIPYQENKLLFSYCAAFFEGGDYNQFSFWLEGFDTEWSEWTRKTEKEYTNLPYGSYTFKVKAKNVFEVESAIETYSFIILPPWYLNWWMIPLYLLFFTLVVYGIVKWRVNRLNKEKEKLEKIIQDNTREIKSQNEELIINQEEILSQRDHLEEQNKNLEESKKIIALHNQELESAVEKRTLELAEMNQELSDRYRQLEQFSFIAAHNLRSPVARILGLISILDKKNLSNPENDEVVDNLLISAKDLDAIIYDLGVIVNVQKGQSLEYLPVDLYSLTETIKKQYIEEIKKSDISVKIISTLTHINTISVYFSSILTNLISNAIKYHSEKSKPLITIDLSQNNGMYRLVVEDNGIGFESEKFTEKIFEPFQRFHTHNDGKGLGLFLVKTQVNAMGGSIALSSKPGEGTRVEIELPFKELKSV